MASPNRPARLNRTLLILLGLVLLLVGGAGALLGTGALSGLPAGIPGLSAVDPSAPLFSAPPSPPTWAAYVAVAASIVVGLLCLRWLLAQTLRRPKTGTWTLPALAGAKTAGGTRIASDHAADAVVADVTGYAGVGKASAHLTGRQSRPTLHLDVTTGLDASATVLRQTIHDHALPRLREALDLDGLDARLVLRMDTSTPSRTV